MRVALAHVGDDFSQSGAFEKSVGVAVLHGAEEVSRDGVTVSVAQITGRVAVPIVQNDAADMFWVVKFCLVQEGISDPVT